MCRRSRVVLVDERFEFFHQEPEVVVGCKFLGGQRRVLFEYPLADLAGHHLLRHVLGSPTGPLGLVNPHRNDNRRTDLPVPSEPRHGPVDVP